MLDQELKELKDFTGGFDAEFTKSLNRMTAVINAIVRTLSPGGSGTPSTGADDKPETQVVLATRIVDGIPQLWKVNAPVELVSQVFSEADLNA